MSPAALRTPGRSGSSSHFTTHPKEAEPLPLQRRSGHTLPIPLIVYAQGIHRQCLVVLAKTELNTPQFFDFITVLHHSDSLWFAFLLFYSPLSLVLKNNRFLIAFKAYFFYSLSLSV